MKNDKRQYEPAEIKIVLLNRDLLITSGGTLAEDGWDFLTFESLLH